jgi:hypothetical protein
VPSFGAGESPRRSTSSLGHATTVVRIFKKLLYPLELRLRAKRQAKLDKIVSGATDRVAEQISAFQPPLSHRLFYGASAIHPRHLVTWYIFGTDGDLKDAAENGLTSRIDTLTRHELAAGGYPEVGIPRMHVSFTSKEDVERKTGGNYYLYFK